MINAANETMQSTYPVAVNPFINLAHSQYGNTAALDMESYAVMYAVKSAPEPKPNGLIIKSVCDYADEEKSDKYQKFAAFTSAQFAKLLYEKFLDC